MSTLPAVITIRWIAASQALGVVLIHGIWMLFIAHTWTEAYPKEQITGAVINKAMAVFKWLGGMGPDGHHANNDTLLVVWFKLSPLMYLLAELWRWKRGPRPPVRWWVMILWSTGTAFAGFSFALWAAVPALLNLPDALWLLAAMTITALLVTTWAVLSDRLGERLIALIRPKHHQATTGP